jgi:two-component system, OmpR family, alkaline phosphatase synthesis response regulator PhoP
VKILLVEDEPTLRHGLTDLLEGAGYGVVAIADGETAAARGAEADVDLVVLDLTLPDLDGLEVCRRLRRARPGLGILMLTARVQEDDKVLGLGSGADDYVTKPFAVRELLARLEALARRAKRDAGPVPEQIENDGCAIDLGRCTASRDGQTVGLTAREARLLRLLYQNRVRAMTRGELLEKVWEASSNLQTRTVDMTIANLRQKIERDPAAPRIITTVKGVGYAWGPR